MDEIDKITELLKTTEDPFVLADCLTKLGGWASYYGEQMKKVQLRKPEAWLKLQTHIHAYGLPGAGDNAVTMERSKPLSDKKTEMTWSATEDGQKEIALIWELKRIEQMSQAIKKALYVKKVEYGTLNQNI